MVYQSIRLARAARLWAALLAMVPTIASVSPCFAQLEPLPRLPATVEYAPTPLDQGSPFLSQVAPPVPSGAPYPGSGDTSAESIWTPYGQGSVSHGPDSESTSSCEPCYDGIPTGFENSDGPWESHVMPKSLIWHSYLAGPWEPRFASVWSSERDEGWLWDVALGGRASLYRYGTGDSAQPSGWEIQVEGAAFPRLDPENSVDVMATDYRFGVPVAYGNGPYQMKIGFYHISSHLGDEYMISNPTVERINFGRNALAWGHSYYATPDLRLYLEVDWAWDCMYSEPWYYQFGFDWAPILRSGNQCAPFVAVNCQLREELNFSGHFVAQAGWAWRYGADRRMFRVGLQYYDGGNQQFEFYKNNEQKLGLGLWYDF